jgi:hypothetical protein
MRSRLTMFTALLLAVLAAPDRAPAATSGAAWQVVLAAGDDHEPVFDDATRTLAQRMRNAGVPAPNIRRLSASNSEIRKGIEPATADNLLRNIAAMPARPGDRCFIFLTSHGEYNEGLWLARSQRALHPRELAQVLSRGCASVPTVVVVSACYSGGFAAGAMLAPNRIILTASRRDRASFGCQVARTYSFFDGCFLRALPDATDWRTIFRATSACVARDEKALDEPPSEPQAYFSPAVAGLAARS